MPRVDEPTVGGRLEDFPWLYEFCKSLPKHKPDFFKTKDGSDEE